MILLFDGDVAQHETYDALEAHRRANRTVRIARLPVNTDPNDMLQAGRGAELLAILTGAEAKESRVVEIEKALLRYPFDEAGHARYMADRRELAKRFKLRQEYLDQVRARLARAVGPPGGRGRVEIHYHRHVRQSSAGHAAGGGGQMGACRIGKGLQRLRSAIVD